MIGCCRKLKDHAHCSQKNSRPSFLCENYEANPKSSPLILVFNLFVLLDTTICRFHLRPMDASAQNWTELYKGNYARGNTGESMIHVLISFPTLQVINAAKPPFWGLPFISVMFLYLYWLYSLVPTSPLLLQVERGSAQEPGDPYETVRVTVISSNFIAVAETAQIVWGKIGSYPFWPVSDALWHAPYQPLIFLL